ncbi:VWA domain-containing protein [Nonomuraea sp. NBC_00507]|uniref:vWA domain-containing protein n=1 Tax=unclassified Nonomuraea TaxID=2593643 RepID=UPI00273BD472|nr:MULTISPECIES: vWA domain-containing protein [unclassified Nonomuraea]MDP4504006.1 vWA domain-containing protein [Nonomuraea sp. G32]
MRSANGRPRAFPFYIVCDVSHSMHTAREDGRPTPFEILSNCVGELLFELEAGDPGVSEAAHVAVVSFSDKVELVLPLTRPCDAIRVPALKPGRQTDYLTVFSELVKIIEKDYRKLSKQFDVRAPVVFFITDGEPYVGQNHQDVEIWGPARDRLASLNPAPYIVALGFGTVQEDTLRRVATTLRGEVLAFVGEIGTGAATVLHGIAQAVSDSISASVNRNTAVLRGPGGMRQLR